MTSDPGGERAEGAGLTRFAEPGRPGEVPAPTWPGYQRRGPSPRPRSVPPTVVPPAPILGSEPEFGPRAITQPVPEPVPEPAAEPEPEPAAEPEPEPAAEPQPDSLAEPEAVTEPLAEPEREPVTEPEPVLLLPPPRAADASTPPQPVQRSLRQPNPDRAAPRPPARADALRASAPMRRPPIPVTQARRPQVSYQAGDPVRGHERVAERTADLAVSVVPMPLRVLDVGCGDGWLLDELITRVPHSELHVGVDPIPTVLTAARQAVDPRIRLLRSAAEGLPFDDASFDLVLSVLSVGYWTAPRAGLAELARVVSDHGKVIVVDRAHGRGRLRGVGDLLADVGLRVGRVDTLQRSVLGRPSVRAYIAFHQ